jgi:vacuolar iron transporter family protein
MIHNESHKTSRTGWLRAAVLGANDGIVSTASLILGVAASGASAQNIIVAGSAGLVAGAMSMAAGEYVSVSSQADTETADLNREKKELEDNPEEEHAELTKIYIDRGLNEASAADVATQLMQHDALGAHARDELGISEVMAARPVQAAFASAGSFVVGAVLPLLIVVLIPVAKPFLVCSQWLALFSRLARCRFRIYGWCSGNEGHRACYILGRSRNGVDCRRWSNFWSGSITTLLWILSTTIKY